MVSPNISTSSEVAGITTGSRGFVAPELHTAPTGQMFSSTISWGAIIAGALMSLSLLMLSSFLAFAFHVSGYVDGQYGWGAGIWAVVSVAIAFCCGGCVSAYFSPPADGRANSKMMHGVMTWALALLMMAFFFAGSFSAYISHNGPSAMNLNSMNNMNATSSSMNGTAAAWGAFISIAVGLVAAAFGGMTGFRRHSSV